MSKPIGLQSLLNQGEPGVQFVFGDGSERVNSFEKHFFKIYPKLKSWFSKKPRKSSMEVIYIKSFGGSKSLWTRFKELFKRKYKPKELFDKNGELDVKALLSNHKNKKKSLKELSYNLGEGYIHAPFLPVMNAPSYDVFYKGKKITETYGK